MKQMGRPDQHPSSRNALPAVLIAAAVLFGALVLVVGRQLKFESPASHHAKSLLKLDNMLGATLEPLDVRTAQTLGGGSRADEMVVTSVASDGRATTAGLRIGDVVEKVDGRDPQNIDDAIDAVSTDPTRILVNRHGSQLTLNIPEARASSRR